MESNQDPTLVLLSATFSVEVLGCILASRDLCSCVTLKVEGLSSCHLPTCQQFALGGLRERLAESGRWACDGKRLPLSFPEGLLIYTIFALLRKGHCQAAFKRCVKVTLIRCSGEGCRQPRLSSKRLQVFFESSTSNLDPPPLLAEPLVALAANFSGARGRAGGPGSRARWIIARVWLPGKRNEEEMAWRGGSFLRRSSCSSGLALG